MNTFAIVTTVRGGWIMALAQLAVILVCAVVLHRVFRRLEMPSRDARLFSLGYVLFNLVAYEILVTLVFFPKGEYYDHGTTVWVIAAVAATLPAVLALAIGGTARALRKRDPR